MVELEVVIPVRDKDPRLLENCLDSVKRALFGKIIIHMVDLGSNKDEMYRDMAKDYGFQYSYVEHNEWNKPLALNYALKRSEAQWFGILDGDYIIEERFFEKIFDVLDFGNFYQCRGYEMGEDFSDLSKLNNHESFCEVINKYKMESRPKSDYGGFQCIPTTTAKEIGGYDERFRLYGGMHHEIRNRLINFGLKENRLHGNPKLIHQTHDNWFDQNKSFEVAKERERHKEIIRRLAMGNQYHANVYKKWGEA